MNPAHSDLSDDRQFEDDLVNFILEGRKRPFQDALDARNIRLILEAAKETYEPI